MVECGNSPPSNVARGYGGTPYDSTSLFTRHSLGYALLTAILMPIFILIGGIAGADRRGTGRRIYAAPCFVTYPITQPQIVDAQAFDRLIFGTHMVVRIRSSSEA